MSIRKDDDYFDILMLGGSVLRRKYGAIEQYLQEKLTYKSKRRIRTHNVSLSAHSSLDSYYKYRHLSRKRFDLVMVYHGVNEVRANNCPSSLFQKDYSHIPWYRLINDFERDMHSRLIVLPYTLKFLLVRLDEELEWSDHVPKHTPRKEWVEFGCMIKTTQSFSQNLRGILDIAEKRGEIVLLMTFSWYLPEGYSLERFSEKSLEYTMHVLPFELFGKPECVVKGIAAHNAIIKNLAGQYDHAIFVDQNTLIPEERMYFNDPFHLSYKGSELFVDNILDKILELM